ncbi:hypothetical protein FACS18942_07870 [Planctomycetales bacterium]|nr:hypothetical protein FACS18942_07870 [Planctomycetales bacterium]GHT34844.1 hypothetical protein FACS189427_02920 [Planctomycetales bacterium]
MFTLFPGYSGIARYGLWTQLSIAVFFALLLDYFLIVNFYWTDYITAGQRNILLGGLILSYFLLRSAAKLHRQGYETMLSVETKDETYRTVLQYYLRGNWFDAESLILPYLKKKPRDIEMQLLLATLYRHTQRFEEANAVIEKIESMDGAGKWFCEIEAEKRYIGEGI